MKHIVNIAKDKKCENKPNATTPIQRRSMMQEICHTLYTVRLWVESQREISGDWYRLIDMDSSG